MTAMSDCKPFYYTEAAYTELHTVPARGAQTSDSAGREGTIGLPLFAARACYERQA